MLFSSISFLYYFLPVLLVAYFIAPKKIKNSVLLVFSMLFYFYGEPRFLAVLLFSGSFNYVFAAAIEKHRKNGKLLFIISLSLNIGLLLYFKYSNFFILNINTLFNAKLSLLNAVLPIGISFYTFQAISYVADVYRGDVKASENFFDFITYLSFFPQLVAGPIVRYKTIEDELRQRTVRPEDFSFGVNCFTIGLGKKVLIANVIGELLKNLSLISTKSVLSEWMVAAGFTLQIYYDFSGYSDMAIGLGRMFGFHFLENFNYPFISSSVTEFWRRWHISLSAFFRDYVYFPMGGSRVAQLKWLLNMLTVWLLTGLWHGAAWNFIVWGLYFFIILVIEKVFIGKYLSRTKIIKYVMTMLIVVFSFVIFNSDKLSEAIISIKNLLFLGGLSLYSEAALYYLKSSAVLLVIAIIGSTPLMRNIAMKLNQKYPTVWEVARAVFVVIVLMLSTAFLIDSSFNPFLYFRF